MSMSKTEPDVGKIILAITSILTLILGAVIIVSVSESNKQQKKNSCQSTLNGMGNTGRERQRRKDHARADKRTGSRSAGSVHMAGIRYYTIKV